MRIGEIPALGWKRVDLLGATVEIAENYNASTDAGVRSDRVAANLVALVPAHPRDAFAY